MSQDSAAMVEAAPATDSPPERAAARDAAAGGASRLRRGLAGARPAVTRRRLYVGVVLLAAALFVTLLTVAAGRPPGIDTPGHLFKAWEIARDAERHFLSLHAWTQDWYLGHPLYHYYPPASYFVIGALDYVLDNIDLSYRVYLFGSYLAGGVVTYLLARRWLGPFAATLAALFYEFAPYTMKMVFWEGNVPRTLTLALAPLVFYFAVRAVDDGRRRYYVCLSLAIAALIFTHHMPGATTLALLSVFIIVYAFLRVPFARLAWLGGAVALGVGLTAIWLLPAITNHDLPDVPNLGALPERLPSYSTFPTVLFDPRFQWRDYEAMNGYLGAASVLAALVGVALWRYRWLAASLLVPVLVGVVLSMGSNTPLYDHVEFLQRWFPERFLQPTALLLALLAAAGIQSLTRYVRIPPLPRLAAVLLLVALVAADSAPFIRYTQGSPNRAREISDTRLASQWLKGRADNRRLFSFTARDWSTGFAPARIAGINSTSGWNPEGTPHNLSIGQLNAALARDNYDYIFRTLRMWDVGYALLDEGAPPRARLAAEMEKRGWRRADLDFEGDFVLLADRPSPGARLMYNPLPVAVVGGGGGSASLISPNVADTRGNSPALDDMDIEYLSLFDKVLLFGYQWRDVKVAEEQLRALLARGVTVIDALPASPGHVFLGGKAETIRFSGKVTLRNAPGQTLLPEEGIEVGPFFFESGDWTAAVIADGGEPLLVADINGKEQVVAAASDALSGRMIYLGLSLITQAELRSDAGARRVVQTLLDYDREAVTAPAGFPAEDFVWNNEQVSFRYAADEDATVLLSMTYFPAWTAAIDGQPLRLFRHERLTLMRLPAGSHTVKLAYGLTPFQRRAGVISLASLAMLLAPWWWRWIARLARRGKAPAPARRPTAGALEEPSPTRPRPPTPQEADTA